MPKHFNKFTQLSPDNGNVDSRFCRQRKRADYLLVSMDKVWYHLAMTTRTPTRPERHSPRSTHPTFDAGGNTSVAILNRVMQPDATTLTADAARTLLSLKFEKTDERRMERLSAKARQGALTDQEQFEAEQYNLVSHLLALLQAKARHVLKRPGRNPETA
jgi:uncharacterized protein (DUF2236 family)